MTNDIKTITIGSPFEAIEAAKRIIASKRRDTKSLIEISRNKLNKVWSRVAAIYVLGFIYSKNSGEALAEILKDSRDETECRAHAAEALSHVDHPMRVPIMRGILETGTEPTEVKKWCVYALGEIGGEQARGILLNLSDKNLPDELRNELRDALAHWR